MRRGRRSQRREDRFSRYQSEWMADVQDSVEITPSRIGIFFVGALLITQICTYLNFYKSDFERLHPKLDTIFSHWADRLGFGDIITYLAAIAVFAFSCKYSFDADVAIGIPLLMFLDDGLLQNMNQNPSICMHIVAIYSALYCCFHLQEELSATFSSRWYKYQIGACVSGIIAVGLYPESSILMFVILGCIWLSIYRSTVAEKFSMASFAYMVWFAILPFTFYWFFPFRWPEFDFNWVNWKDEFRLLQWNVGTLIPIIAALPLMLSMKTRRIRMYLLLTVAIVSVGLFFNTGKSHDSLRIRMLDVRIVASVAATVVLGRQRFMAASFFVILVSFGYGWVKREQFLPVDIDFI